MKISTLILAGIAAVALAGCAVTQQDGVMEAQTRKGGLLGLSTNDTVEVQTPKAFAAKQKIVIGGFKVGFNDSKSMQNKAGGGALLGRAMDGNSTGLVKLEGIDPATRQAITDAAYSDFIASLKAQGYEVVDRNVFTSSPAFEGTKTYTFPYENDDSGLLSSYGTAMYYSPTAIGPNQPFFSGEVEGMSGGFAFANPASAAAEFGKSTGIAVINVAYFVDFAASTGTGGRWSTTSNLKVGQLLAADQGVLGIISGEGGTFSTGVGSLRLGQPIGSEKEFATITQTSTTAEKTFETATNLASVFMGGGTNQKRRFVYDANPAHYKAAAVDVLQQANRAFVSKMVELR